jgi:hypothetical protein
MGRSIYNSMSLRLEKSGSTGFGGFPSCSRLYVVVLPSFINFIPLNSSPYHLLHHGYDPLDHSGRYCASIHFSSPLIRLPRSSKETRPPLSSWPKTMANNWKFTQLSQGITMDLVHRNVQETRLGDIFSRGVRFTETSLSRRHSVPTSFWAGNRCALFPVLDQRPTRKARGNLLGSSYFAHASPVGSIPPYRHFWMSSSLSAIRYCVGRRWIGSCLSLGMESVGARDER